MPTAGSTSVARAGCRRATSPAPRRCCARRSRGRSRARQVAFLPGHGAEGARTLRRSARPSARSGGPLPARSRRAQPDRTRAVPQAAVSRSAHRIPPCSGDRPRGSAGALQPDARVPGTRRSGGGAGTRLYERFKADESAQSITGPYRRLHPDDNNERQPIHEHGTLETGRRRHRLAARTAATAGAAASGDAGCAPPEAAAPDDERAAIPATTSMSAGHVAAPIAAWRRPRSALRAVTRHRPVTSPSAT